MNSALHTPQCALCHRRVAQALTISPGQLQNVAHSSISEERHSESWYQRVAHPQTVCHRPDQSLRMLISLQGLSVGDKLQDYPDYYRYSAKQCRRLIDVCLATISLRRLLSHQCLHPTLLLFHLLLQATLPVNRVLQKSSGGGVALSSLENKKPVVLFFYPKVSGCLGSVRTALQASMCVCKPSKLEPACPSAQSPGVLAQSCLSPMHDHRVNRDADSRPLLASACCLQPRRAR